MCNYKLTVIIGKNSDIVDGGGWVTSMTWRKSTILEAKDRAQVLALRDLLNSSKPAVDEDGYLMWNRCYGMCNKACWQWELACAHSSCINQIMRRADVDWADAGVPDIDMPTITINLSINRSKRQCPTNNRIPPCTPCNRRSMATSGLRSEGLGRILQG